MVPPNRQRTIRIDNASDHDDDDPVIILDNLPIPPVPEPDLDGLAAALDNLTVRDAADHTLYETSEGITPHWYAAARMNTPQSPVRSLIKRSRSRKTAKAYVVFVGVQPGVYHTWDDCEDNVKGTSGNIYRGYRTVQAANDAFAYARAQGLTRRTTEASEPINYRIEWEAPVEWDFTDSNPLSAGVTEVRWYVVYVGLNPGIYATTLEAQLQILGIPQQTHEVYKSFQTARTEFLNAMAHKKVGRAVVS